MIEKKLNITLKLAMSVDGYLDNVSPFRFSNELDRYEVQKIRGEVDAILIGSNTLNRDNPSLIISDQSIVEGRLNRGMTGQPIRIVLCGKSPIKLNSNLFNDKLAETVIFSRQNFEDKDLKNDLVSVKTYSTEKIEMEELCDEIYKLGVRNLLVEGGASIALQFLNAGLVNRLRIAYSPTIIENPKATKIFPLSKKHIESSKSVIENLDEMYAQNFYFS